MSDDDNAPNVPEHGDPPVVDPVPEPPKVDPPKVDPPPPPDPPKGATLDDVAGKIDTLIEAFQSALPVQPPADVDDVLDPDVSPVKPPWLFRG